MTDKNKLEAIRKRIARLEADEITGFEQTYSAIADVRSIIDLIPSSSLPAPTHDGTAEEVLKESFERIWPNYLASTMRSVYAAKIILPAMTTCAAPLRAEIERLKGELADNNMHIQRVYDAAKDREEYITWAKLEIERLRKDVELANTGKSEYFRMLQDQLHRTEKLIGELAAANQRIKELEKDLEFIKLA